MYQFFRQKKIAYHSDFILKNVLERGTRFELAHPRVEALVHSLYYVTPAKSLFSEKEYMYRALLCQIYFLPLG